MKEKSPEMKTRTLYDEFEQVFAFYANYLFCEPRQLVVPARIVCSSNTFTRLNPDKILIYHHLQTHILSIPFTLTGLMGPIVEKLPPSSHRWAEKILTLLKDRKEVRNWDRFEDWYLTKRLLSADAKNLVLAWESPQKPTIRDPEAPNGSLEVNYDDLNSGLNYQRIGGYLEHSRVLRLKLSNSSLKQIQVLGDFGFQNLFTWEVIEIDF